MKNLLPLILFSSVASGACVDVGQVGVGATAAVAGFWEGWVTFSFIDDTDIPLPCNLEVSADALETVWMVFSEGGENEFVSNSGGVHYDREADTFSIRAEGEIADRSGDCGREFYEFDAFLQGDVQETEDELLYVGLIAGAVTAYESELGCGFGIHVDIQPYGGFELVQVAE